MASTAATPQNSAVLLDGDRIERVKVIAVDHPLPGAGYGRWICRISSKFKDLRQTALFEIQSFFNCLAYPCTNATIRPYSRIASVQADSAPRLPGSDGPSERFGGDLVRAVER